eukprot:s3790_g27.t1
MLLGAGGAATLRRCQGAVDAATLRRCDAAMGPWKLRRCNAATLRRCRPPSDAGTLLVLRRCDTAQPERRCVAVGAATLPSQSDAVTLSFSRSVEAKIPFNVWVRGGGAAEPERRCDTVLFKISGAFDFLRRKVVKLKSQSTYWSDGAADLIPSRLLGLSGGFSASRLLGFSACLVASRLLGFSACLVASRLLGFLACPVASRLLGFWALFWAPFTRALKFFLAVQAVLCDFLGGDLHQRYVGYVFWRSCGSVCQARSQWSGCRFLGAAARVVLWSLAAGSRKSWNGGVKEIAGELTFEGDST